MKFKLPIKPTTCISCLSKYIKLHPDDEECLFCLRRKTKPLEEDELRLLTARLNRRREYVEKEIKRFGKYYGFINE